MKPTETKHRSTKALVESALLLALATVLSELPLVELPYGGSVTVASMLPVLLISYRHGLLWGFGSATAFGVIQQLFGLKNLSYFSTWQSIVTLILLDYVVAFAIIGLGGIFRKQKSLPQWMQLLLGAVTVCVLRYICHVITGATIWVGLSIPDSAALGYSLIYNATYMVPETIILCLLTYYLGTVLDFRRDQLRRMPAVAAHSPLANWLFVLAGALGTGALVFDVCAVFSRLQDAETGRFSVEGLRVERFAGSFWMWVVIVTAVAAVGMAVLLLVRRRLLSDHERVEQ
ncbi:MAG: hypothetical protein E7644_02385 [Ruminococcaceae bacterium]|nr:hypothetical protein [Oscillospiraceae bacterium]